MKQDITYSEEFPCGEEEPLLMKTLVEKFFYRSDVNSSQKYISMNGNRHRIESSTVRTENKRVFLEIRLYGTDIEDRCAADMVRTKQTVDEEYMRLRKLAADFNLLETCKVLQ